MDAFLVRRGLGVLVLTVLGVGQGFADALDDRIDREQRFINELSAEFRTALSSYLAWQAYADQYANTARPGLYQRFPELTFYQPRPICVPVVNISGRRRDEIVFHHQYWEKQVLQIYPQLIAANHRMARLSDERAAAAGVGGRARGVDNVAVGNPFFKNLDANADGVITLKEWLAGTAARMGEVKARETFRNMDLNKDGKVTCKEFEARK